MDKLTFERLQPEIFYAQPWIQDFVDVYAEVLNDRIRYPIYQLETIRDITKVIDPWVVTQTLKQIGFDLPQDFIKHNIPTLNQAIPQLSIYAERSGTKDYPHTIAFILGRSVDAIGLYTENYQDFYSQAYGPLQVDGGDWFKTTHIELGMQYLPQDYKLLLPRGKTIKDRFLEAFYEFAPWNIVVERFFFNVDVGANLHLSGRIVKQPKRYIDVGVGEMHVENVKIVGPTEVYEGSEQEFELIITLANGSEGTPGTPDIPGTPGTPYIPEVPYQPAVPAVPGSPEIPYQPAKPEVQAQPAVPEIPYQAGKPEVPYQAAVPEVQYKPAVPATPYQPAVPPKDAYTQTGTFKPLMGVAGWNAQEATISTFAEIEPNSEFSIDAPGENDYGYVCYPKAMGEARFTDKVSNFEGGWDGASWPDQDVGDEYGPIEIERTVNGVTLTWYLYRTDFSGIGSATYDFQVPNPQNGTYSIYHEAVPGKPEVPANPGSPEVPYQAAKPEVPYQAAVPEIPYQAGKPAVPYQPATPEIPYQAAVPAVPGKPEVPYQPAVPATPGTPAIPGTPATPAVDTYFTQTVRVKGVWNSSRTGLVGFNGDFASFGNVSFDTDVVIYGEYEGMSASLNVKVKNSASNIRTIEIQGPDSVRANEFGTYQVVAHTTGGDETHDLTITTRSTLGYMQGNNLHVYQIDADGEVILSAECKLPDGQTLTAVKKVQAIFVDPDVHLVDLEILGPDSFYENEVKQYTLVAHYSDGTHKGVLGAWDPGCGAIYITPDGEAYITETLAELDITFKATHQYKGVKLTATKPVSFLRRTVSVVHTEILGPNQVVENTKNRYVVSARFSDGSTGIVDADWTTNRFYIDERGYLEVGSVGSTPVNLQLRARVNGRDAIKQIVAINTPVTLDNILVMGPDNVREGSLGKFTAYAHYSNGRDVEITPTWSIKGDPAWASIDVNGLLSFEDPLVGIVEVVATYRLGGKAYVQSKPLVLIPNTRIIQGLIISGPNTVMEGARIVLTGTAVYSDGLLETVSPQWTVQSADPLNDPDPMADIVSPGVLQGRVVEKDTKVTAIARYFKEIAEFEITVTPRIVNSPDKPVSSRIIGPAAFYVTERGSYSHAIVFEECANELLVSSDWTIDADPLVAAIDSAGFVWSVNGKSTTATITSTYQCGTYTLVDSMVINIIGDEDQLKSLAIYGPETINGAKQELYTSELFRNGETETPGKGHPVQPEWSIVSPDGRVVVNGAGQVNVIDASKAFKFILKATYKEGFETVTATKEISVIAEVDSTPIYGLAQIGVRNDPAIADKLTNHLPTMASGQKFTLTAGAGEYMYFCYPATLGLAKFVDQASNFEGGFDGASWPDDGSVGEQYGPITVARTDASGTTSNWYLYRSDFDGNGTMTFEVTFGN